jgi:hypothetical protein
VIYVGVIVVQVVPHLTDSSSNGRGQENTVVSLCRAHVSSEAVPLFPLFKVWATGFFTAQVAAFNMSPI